MTPAERQNPKMIDGSRRARISRASGTHVSDVNPPVDRFFEARTMIVSMAAGGGMPRLPGIPGMGGIGGGKRAKAKQAPKKGKAKRKSGNPAKRAEQEKAAAARANGDGGNPFGLPAGDEDVDPSSFELPDDISKYLNR
jgi:signal recognition particle subunit SRP54